MYSIKHSTPRLWWLLATVVLLAGIILPASAADTGRILHVAAFGIDSATCGTPSQTCRTINRAIRNAMAGDTILVGPGRYGDLNFDQDETDAGEEGTPVSEPCVICIRKRLKIYSTDGASATVLIDTRREVVGIFADGTVFGARENGLTIAGSLGGAFVVHSAGNVHVTGNISTGAGVGFFFDAERGPIFASWNSAVGNSTAGFLLNSGVQGRPGYVDFRHNIVFGNSESGMVVDGWVPHNVVGNSIVGNFGSGIEARNNSFISRNTIIGAAVGVLVNETGNAINFGVPGGGVRLRNNLIVGNHGAGIIFPSNSAAPNHQLHLNEIYANGTKPLNDDRISPSELPVNCGLINLTAGIVNATNNFWGAASGPGADPADKAGANSGCDLAGTTLVKPFAATPSTTGP